MDPTDIDCLFPLKLRVGLQNKIRYELHITFNVNESYILKPISNVALSTETRAPLQVPAETYEYIIILLLRSWKFISTVTYEYLKMFLIKPLALYLMGNASSNATNISRFYSANELQWNTKRSETVLDFRMADLLRQKQCGASSGTYGVRTIFSTEYI